MVRLMPLAWLLWGCLAVSGCGEPGHMTARQKASKDWSNSVARGVIIALADDPHVYEVQRIERFEGKVHEYGQSVMKGPAGLQVGQEVFFDWLWCVFVCLPRDAGINADHASKCPRRFDGCMCEDCLKMRMLACAPMK